MSKEIFSHFIFFEGVSVRLTLFLREMFTKITSEAIWTWSSLVVKFLTTNSFSLIVQCFFRTRIFLWVSFCNLYLSKNLFISSKLLIYWHKIFHNIFYAFNMSGVCSNSLSFTLDISNLCIHYFFLDYYSQSLLIVFIF